MVFAGKRMCVVLVAVCIGCSDSSPTSPTDYGGRFDLDQDNGNRDDGDDNAYPELCEASFVRSRSSRAITTGPDHYVPRYNMLFRCDGIVNRHQEVRIQVSTRAWVNGRLYGEARHDERYGPGDELWLCGKPLDWCGIPSVTGVVPAIPSEHAFEWYAYWVACPWWETNRECEFPDYAATPQGLQRNGVGEFLANPGSESRTYSVWRVISQ